MKSLTLFRHAKTERESNTGRDFDRMLNERGQRDAKRIGKEVRKLGLQFDLGLSSPARRAAETADLAGLPAQYDERIYNASAGELLAIVQEAGNAIDRLVMVGHNPGFAILASRLIGQNIELPTGSLAEIELPISHWRDAGRVEGALVRLLKPKELD